MAECLNGRTDSLAAGQGLQRAPARTLQNNAPRFITMILKGWYGALSQRRHNMLYNSDNGPHIHIIPIHMPAHLNDPSL